MSVTDSQVLTTQEVRLNKLEEIIQKEKWAFVAVGVALYEVKELKLYEVKYPSWNNYCKNRWGFKRAHADQLIQTADAFGKLPKEIATIVANQGQGRALAGVPESERVQVLEAASKQAEVEGRDMTARDIKEVAEKKKTAQDFADELAKSHPIKPDDSEPVDVESEVVETESAYDRHSNNIRNAWTEFMDEADKDSIDKMIKMFRDRIKDMQKRRGS